MGNKCGQICHNQHQVSDNINSNDTSDEPSTDFAIKITQDGYDATPKAKQTLNNSKNDLKIALKITTEPQDHIFKGRTVYRIKPYEVDYLGDFKKGRPHGKGYLVFKDGAYFSGHFVYGVVEDGQGVYVSDNGAYYCGEFKNNQRSGHGKFVDGGYQYEGQWMDNLPNRKGKEVFPNGDTFTGQFKNGLRRNQGVYEWHGESGLHQMTVNFNEDKANGRGKLSDRSNNFIEGVFSCKDDKLQVTQCTVNQSNKTVIKGAQLVYFDTNLVESQSQLQDKLPKFMSGQYNPKQTYKIFEQYLLLDYKDSMPKSQIQNIIKIVEKIFEKVEQYDTALQEISSELRNYQCLYYKEDRQLSSRQEKQTDLLKNYVLMEIADSKLAVIQK